jgi:L-ribulose-5-phosphate 3-epimerase
LGSIPLLKLRNSSREKESPLGCDDSIDEQRRETIMKIGVRSVNLKMDMDSVLIECQKMGLDGIQVSPRECVPDEMSRSDREAFVKKVKAHDLVICAMNGGPNLSDPKGIDDRIEQYKKILQLSADLGPGIVTGESKAKLPEIGDEEAWEVTVNSVGEIVGYGKKIGARFAIEPGPRCFIRTPEDILRLCKEVDGLRVNYDPANVLRGGSDPVEGVKLLGSLIIHTHAKDARNLPGGRGEETPLGQGQVNFPEYIAALRQVGFDGFLTIEREGGENRLQDIRQGKELLERLLQDV